MSTSAMPAMSNRMHNVFSPREVALMDATSIGEAIGREMGVWLFRELLI